jgi:hypothetical protein
MNSHVFARSISRPVHALLSSGQPVIARVLGSSPRACTLVTSEGHVVVLVPPGAGDGPLNVVLEAVFEGVAVDTPAVFEEGVLSVGRLAVSIKGAEVWEPCPDWAGLTELCSHAAERLPHLWAITEKAAPRESLFWSVWVWCHGVAAPAGTMPAAGGLSDRVRHGAKALAAGWGGDPEQAALGAAQLAGLGRGLTPAGDDFLLGVMLWAWLVHPDPRAYCRVLVEAAVSRTTTLSAAWLQAAADGQFGAPLHQLLVALVGKGELEVAASRVLGHGATSGADTLAGLLWMGAYRPP